MSLWKNLAKPPLSAKVTCIYHHGFVQAMAMLPTYTLNQAPLLFLFQSILIKPYANYRVAQGVKFQASCMGRGLVAVQIGHTVAQGKS